MLRLTSNGGPTCGGIIYHNFGYLGVFISAYGLVGLDLGLRLLMLERQAEHMPTFEYSDVIGEGGNESGIQAHPTMSPGENARVSQDNATNSLSPPSSSTSQQSSLRTSVSPTEDVPLLSKQNASTTVTAPRSALVELLATPRMLAAILGSFMQSFIMTELESTIPLHIKRLFQYNSKDVALVFLVLSLPSFGAPVVGAMSDRYGPKFVVSMGFVFLTPFLILLRLVNENDVGHVALLCILLFAIGVALNLVLTPVFSEAMYTVDEKEAAQPGIFGPKGAYAQAFAQMNIAYGAGSLLGPLLGGLLVERIGWNNVTLLTGISCAVCVPACLYATGGTASTGRSRQAG